MSRLIELSDEDYARLEHAAEGEGITPAEWVARHLPVCPEAQPCANGKPAQTLADLFAGHIGRFSSGHGQPRIEDLRESFGPGPAPDEAKPTTMADRFAGRVGLFSGSKGLPSSDNVAQSFAQHLEAKQREGRL